MRRRWDSRLAWAAALVSLAGIAAARAVLAALAFLLDPGAAAAWVAFEAECGGVRRALEESFVRPAEAAEARFVPLLAASLGDELRSSRAAEAFLSPEAVIAAARAARGEATVAAFVARLRGASPFRGGNGDAARVRLRAALRGAVQRLDRFSDLLLGGGAANLALVLRLSFPLLSGIDLVRDASGAVRIDLVVAASGAAAAGLRRGDEVESLDGRPASDLSLADLRDALSRPAELVVRRPGFSAPFRVALGCDAASLLRVESARLPGGIGWIRIPLFYPGSSMHLVDSVRSLREDGARALVLDLRGNPGGAVADALLMADLFLGAGRRLVRFEGGSLSPAARALREKAYESRASEADFGGPLVALVDGSSASASELLAMALRESGRARLVGERTFGKGVAQIVQPLAVTEDAAGGRLPAAIVDLLSVTALRFVSGSGSIDLHGTGLEPDVVSLAAAPPEAEFLAALAGVAAADAYVDSAIPLDGDLAESLARDDGGDPSRYPRLEEAATAIGAGDLETARRRVRARLRARRLAAGLDAGPDFREDPALRDAIREVLALCGVDPADVPEYGLSRRER